MVLPSRFRSARSDIAGRKTSLTMARRSASSTVPFSSTSASTPPLVGVAVGSPSTGVGLWANGVGDSVGGGGVAVRVALLVRVGGGVDVGGGTVLVVVRVRVGEGGGATQLQTSKQAVRPRSTQPGCQLLLQQNGSSRQTQSSHAALPQAGSAWFVQHGSPPGVGVGVGPSQGHFRKQSPLARSTQKLSQLASPAQQMGSVPQTQF